MNPLETSPKILPWLAHEAGISEQRAEGLWHSALKDAAKAAKPGTPEYWRHAIDRVRQSIAAESCREDAASFGWRPWARSLTTLWSARMEAFDEIALAPVRAWRILGQRSHTPLMR